MASWAIGGQILALVIFFRLVSGKMHPFDWSGDMLLRLASHF